MAYKVIKYGGKTKIKDIKTGNSVEIDIEKFMQGGYKRVPKYANGIEMTAEERKRLGYPAPLHASLDGAPVQSNFIQPTAPVAPTYPSAPVVQNNSLEEEKLLGEQLDLENEDRITQEDTAFLNSDYFKNSQNQGQKGAESHFDSLLKGSVNEDFTGIDSEQNNDNIYNIPNPYGGVDIPSAANYLGESIKNKNTVGIIGSGLKVAAGLARNITSGLGRANRSNQVMKNYYEDQKNKKNQPEYFAYGGKKDEELATGEYMHGITNENTEEFNAEIEKGEYFQTNQGDISEVVGDKHSQGGEKIQMEKDDRVLSDKLKLGAKKAKELAEKYDLKLKAKNTYSDVLDKFKRKSKLHKLIEEEASILKKIGEQDKVEDQTTKDFNLEVLTKKKQEIAEKKHPIEEERKVIFEELFEIQEASKPKDKEVSNNFEDGGQLEEVAAEYNITLDRAKELIQKFANGGRGLSKTRRANQSETKEGFFGDITPEQYEKFVKRNASWFDFTNFDPTNKKDVAKLQETYNSKTSGRKVTVDGKFGEQTESLMITPELEQRPGYEIPTNVNNNFSIDTRAPRGVTIESNLVDNNDDLKVREGKDEKGRSLTGAYLSSGEFTLPPTSLQGTIKPERRFDRVRSNEIDVEPYLQDIKDREGAQVKSLEGLSPNVRAAVLANVRANSQTEESKIRNVIDTQNLQGKDKATYANAQIQAREENASAADRLNFEKRQYKAQALTDNELNNYYNQLQDINKQKFMDVHNLNLVNATNEDVYFDGQSYQRKNTDQDILRRIKV